MFAGIMGTSKCKPLLQRLSCVENPLFHEPSVSRVAFEDFGLKQRDFAVGAKGPTPPEELVVQPPG